MVNTVLFIVETIFSKLYGLFSFVMTLQSIYIFQSSLSMGSELHAQTLSCHFAPKFILVALKS